MNKIFSFILLNIFICYSLHAQEDLSSLFADSTQSSLSLPVIETFKGTKLINAQTTKTMHKHELLFLIGHRFGDIGGKNGGAKTFFGMDNVADVLIGFQYGVTNRLSIGLGRDKGYSNIINTMQHRFLYGSIKYRLLTQTTNNSIPFSIAFFERGIVCVMPGTNNSVLDSYFPIFKYRVSGISELIIAHKFKKLLSFEVLPTFVGRNHPSYPEQPNLFALGFGARFRFNKHMSIVADYFLPFRSQESKDYFYTNSNQAKFYNALALGLEIQAGGHVFHINFTNSTAILENQFIPSTTSDFTKGEFRWGFSFSRTFVIGNNKKKWKNK